MEKKPLRQLGDSPLANTGLPRCRFCCGTISLDFVLSTDEYSVVFCRDCQLFLTEPLTGQRGAPAQPLWDQRVWYTMNRYSWSRVLRERTEELLRVLPLTGRDSYSALRMLDVGAGTPDLLTAARRLGVRMLVAVDASHLSCTVVQEAGFAAVRADAQWLPFPEQQFDVVTLCQVVEHLLDPRLLLTEAYTALRPGGVLHLSTPCADNLFSKVSGYRMASSFGPDHVTLFTAASLPRLVASAGFEIVAQRGYTNSFHLASQLVYALTGLRHRRKYSRWAATEGGQSTSPKLETAQNVRSGNPRHASQLRSGLILANWAVRTALGYGLMPFWNPVESRLAHRPGTLPLIEIQARRPS